MVENGAEWASGHGQITKIGLSDGCGGKIVPEKVKIGYCRSGFESYPGNVGVTMAQDDAFISLSEVSKEFGPVRAVDRVSIDIRRGEFFSLLGPSGCGKTTLLRMIAGFEAPSSGEFSFKRFNLLFHLFFVRF